MKHPLFYFLTAFLSALIGALVYIIVYYLIGQVWIAAIMAGIAWLLALPFLRKIRWLKSLTGGK